MSSVTTERTEQRMITIGIVEDDAVVRESLSRLIGKAHGFQCLATCTTGEEALERMPAVRPHVVLMDVNLPEMSGIECTRKLRQLLPETQVLMLTVYEDSDHIFNALKAGASGYLLKRSEPHEVLEAIRDVISGGAPMTSQIARKVVQTFRVEAPSAAQDVKLTERELEILSWLSKGYANKEIADSMCISLPTVRTHLRHIYEKLHVRSRTEAIVKFLH
jgi:DNA-binding NarL/FixJ family response regulator